MCSAMTVVSRQWAIAAVYTYQPINLSTYQLINLSTYQLINL